MLQIPGEVELCRSDLKGTIKSPVDLKGQSLGITDTGSSTDFLRQYLSKKNGVDPTQETRRGVGAGQTFLAAMKQKTIACGMTTEPTVSKALSDGTAFILLDTRTTRHSQSAPLMRQPDPSPTWAGRLARPPSCARAAVPRCSPVSAEVQVPARRVGVVRDDGTGPRRLRQV
ncbi:type 2 periplasmic-binding domain-containing protein [Terrabacter terrigena]|uniref:SsuA/THI5-like domain-containing protein n=1 Tax=Terrabacter terrigena TaxID=574718 RepID=A0ABW3MZF2_9MICO